MAEEFRLRYPLDRTSMVLDVGCYQGAFARDCIARWGCRVMAFEPVPSFFHELELDSSLPPALVQLYPFGLGARTESRPIGVANDGSSVFLLDGRDTAPCEFIDVVNVIRDLVPEKVAGGPRVDLLKLNVEGMEYEILDRLIDSGAIAQIRYLQVQWHNYPVGRNADEWRASIRAKLKATHDEEWTTEPWTGSWIWESHARRS